MTDTRFGTTPLCRAPLTVAALLAFAFALPSFAWAQDDRQALEDELFGGSEDDDAQSSPQDSAQKTADGAQSREDALFGDDAQTDDTGKDSEDRLARALADNDDPLDIGGRLFLQGTYNMLQDTTFASFPLTTPSLLDVYLDARPNDDIRVYARGRLTHIASVSGEPVEVFGQTVQQQQDSARLDQLFLKFNIDQKVFVTAGRQSTRWGSGRFWNPTDFLNQQILDPLALFDLRLGVDLLKFHVPIESLGWNFYAIGLLGGADQPKKAGGAMRLEMLADTAEVAVSLVGGPRQPTRLGADISMGLGILDLHAEAGFSRGVTTPFFRGELSLSPNRLLIPEEFSRKDEYIVQSVFGAEVQLDYGDSDSVFLGAEYFFNSAGYTHGNIYPWLFLNGGFTPLYLGRHYAAAYLFLPSPGEWNDTSFVLSSIFNTSDLSVLTRLDLRMQVLTQMTFNVFIASHAGHDEGEFRLGVDYPDLGGLNVPGLEDGLVIPPQLFDVGVNLAVDW